MKKFDNYYLGLDIGTTSVGWAVTDSQYNILKFNGKYMWGTRLFPEAKTAQERRTHRSSRRRLKRKKERIKILQMLFSEEISKIDFTFFQRLKESMYYKEDKSEIQVNSLFNDSDYKDKDYFKEFPTIYHLRKFLFDGNEPKDIRFLYLAVHHILLHRGHFLFPDSDIDIKNVLSFSNVFQNLQKYLREEMDLEFEWKHNSEIEAEKILKDSSLVKSDKKKKLLELIQISDKKIDSQRKAIIGMMCGCKEKFLDIFQKEEYKDGDITSFSFSESAYDEKRTELEEILNEDILCIDYIKAIYDWTKLSDILKEEESISSAKVKLYNEHQKDLKETKEILLKYSKKEKSTFFRKKEVKDNYFSYINNKCSQEEVNKNLNKIINTLKLEDEDSKKYENLIKRLNLGILFPKQVTKDNGVIPHQIHKYELEKIIENMKRYFPFLNENKDGYTNAEKILKTFSFRIPYYVGPLNSTHSNAWIVKKENLKIYPWNFENIVDLEGSAEKFIQNLINKCTYLKMEDVIPKYSLLYSKFSVLNELNNLKINGEKIKVDLKQKIYKNLFEKEKKITIKKLKKYLKSENLIIDNESQITGIDGDFKTSLSSYIDFYNILGERIKNDSENKMAEDCIRWITLYSGEKKLLIKKIKNVYSNFLTEDEIKKIAALKYQDWGRLSSKFLQEIQSYSPETGELKSIIQMLWENNENLMELLSSKYTFIDEIKNENLLNETKNYKEFSFDNLVADQYFSAPVKRMIWQSLLIVNEIKKITKKPPKKIFIEVARQEELKKERKDSRKNNLLELYKSIKSEARDWKAEIEKISDNDFRMKKLYLYYTQMGKCMYSGESISLDDLFKKNIYDIDHIFPRSKTKDDSIENLVLVKKDINAKKEDDYPIKDEIRRKQLEFWKYLYSKKLIGDKKFDRLARTTGFSDEELSGFIARQLVETRQSTKAIADILKKMLPDSKIVYVKANLTSDFRKCFNILKSRDINDFHHAHDAYLNIVTGNVYNIKFTDNPLNFIKERRAENRKYNLKTEKIFAYYEKDKDFWNPNTMITKIEDFIFNKRPQFTRYSFEQHGGFFDQNIVSKEKAGSGVGYASIKENSKLSDIAKYGGYAKIAGTYFFLVEHLLKGKLVRTIEILPLYLINKIKNSDDLKVYCEEKLNLVVPQIICPRIKYYSLLKINGFLYYITGKTNDSYWLSGAIQLTLEKKYYEYLRNVYIYNSEIRMKDKLDKNFNKELYFYIKEKIKNSIYLKKICNIKYNKSTYQLIDIIENEAENFVNNLSLEEQIKVIIELLNLLQAKNIGADLEIFSAAKKAGISKINKDISDLEEVKLINQSITGLFQNEIDLKKV